MPLGISARAYLLVWVRPGPRARGWKYPLARQFPNSQNHDKPAPANAASLQACCMSAEASVAPSPVPCAGCSAASAFPFWPIPSSGLANLHFAI
jgi:hypothetical protein